MTAYLGTFEKEKPHFKMIELNIKHIWTKMLILFFEP